MRRSPSVLPCGAKIDGSEPRVGLQAGVEMHTSGAAASERRKSYITLVHGLNLSACATVTSRTVPSVTTPTTAPGARP
jgi:hypothetical protein